MMGVDIETVDCFRLLAAMANIDVVVYNEIELSVFLPRPVSRFNSRVRFTGRRRNYSNVTPAVAAMDR